MDQLNTTNKNYQPPQKSNWTGRSASHHFGGEYWHQKIEILNLLNIDGEALRNLELDFALLGYACEEGVKRNVGRVGAKDAPNIFRERLAKLACHHSQRVADFGNIVCVGEDLKTCQDFFSAAIHKLLSQNIFPVAIGGGHDIAYAHFCGLWKAMQDKSASRIGIINFDAHFDLRPVNSNPNSGTPFNQILSEYENVGYFVLGIQQESNTRELYEIAQQKGVRYMDNFACHIANIENIKKEIMSFLAGYNKIYLTIDMDVFSSAYAPGVSASSPVGLEPFFVFEVLDFLLKTKKLIACDIAELNPKFDVDFATASLAARLANFIISRLPKF